jgi:hypothetical protein
MGASSSCQALFICKRSVLAGAPATLSHAFPLPYFKSARRFTDKFPGKWVATQTGRKLNGQPVTRRQDRLLAAGITFSARLERSG